MPWTTLARQSLCDVSLSIQRFLTSVTLRNGFLFFINFSICAILLLQYTIWKKIYTFFENKYSEGSTFCYTRSEKNRNLKILLLFMCVCVSLCVHTHMCAHACHIFQVIKEARKGHKISRCWRYRNLWAAWLKYGNMTWILCKSKKCL